MSAEIEPAVKGAQELEPAIIEFAEATGTLDVIRELTGIVADTVRYRWRVVHQARLLMRAVDKIRATGIPPRAVSDRLLRAVLEDGGFEDDPDMQERWAALLAHEATLGPVPPAYPEILRQLEPVEARALDLLAEASPQALPVAQLGLTDAARIENLERLKLIRDPALRFGTDEVLPEQLAEAFPREVTCSVLGLAFVAVCQGTPRRPIVR